MRKSDIEKFAHSPKASNGERHGHATAAQNARREAKTREITQGVELSASSVAALSSAIVDGLAAKLVELLPVVARIAAADTVHTMQGEDAVMRKAVSEGVKAVEIVRQGVV